MTILTIDTATSQTRIGLSRANEIVEERTSTQARRADDLLLLIDELLAAYQLTPNDLDTIYVRRGLGSYTGLRVGVAVANSLGWALSIPVHGVYSDILTPLSTQDFFAHTEATDSSPLKHWTVVPSYQTWQSDRHSDTVNTSAK